ncbi:MAG: hypothetical protein AAF721_21265 [Myxococcota bacterium]
MSAPLLACAGAESANPFAEDGGGAFTASSSNGGTTSGSSTDGGSGGVNEPGESSAGPPQTSGVGADSETGAAATGTDTDASTTGNADGLPFTLDEVIWLYPDIADWPETISMSSITLEGDLLCMNHDIADQNPAWPIVLAFETTEVVGNAWVFIEEGGQWYAATWEWLRPPGQTCKFATAVAGDHIKVDPFGETSGWVPTSGQSYYFMVSGLIRNPNYSNVMERSNIVEYVWP